MTVVNSSCESRIGTIWSLANIQGGSVGLSTSWAKKCDGLPQCKCAFAWINKDLTVKFTNLTVLLYGLDDHFWGSTSISPIFRRVGNKVKECADEGEQNRNSHRKGEEAEWQEEKGGRERGKERGKHIKWWHVVMIYRIFFQKWRWISLKGEKKICERGWEYGS